VGTAIGARSTAIAGLIGIAATTLVAAVPSLYFAYRAPLARAVLETGEALVGTLVAFLCLERYRRRRRLGDLAIVVAMAVLVFDFPLLNALPRAIWAAGGDAVGKWTELGAWVLAAGLLAAASISLMPPSLRAGSRLRWTPLLVAAPVVAAVLVTVVWIAPNDLDRLLTPELSGRPSPLADPLVTGIQLGASGLFAVAAARLSVAARVRSEPFLMWIAIGCMLAAAASLDYALFPALNPNWLHVGDLFQGAAVLAWSLSAVEEIRVSWAEVSRLAHAEERRRLARDLHDGLAQELAFLVSHSQATAAARGTPDWVSQLRAAAERGLAESRRAILTLSADASLPLDQDLARTANDIAERAGARVELEVSEPGLAPDQQETVVRIVREAVTNATRHGRATRISIHFSNGVRPVLRVCDNGVGFDPADTVCATNGFGLVSMRERAETLGATLAVRSAKGEGTTVEVAWQ
jgi:signal transduction histidine kinase